MTGSFANSREHTAMMQLLKAMENPYLKGIDLHLSRMENLMEAMGHPEAKLPPVIHVAGTNGKGSLLAYLRAMYEAAGKAVHVYTSPHLVRFNERIVLAGKEVGDKPLYDALRKVHNMHQQFPSTLFEGVTAAAFTLFAKNPADVLLLEVGLGGRLDATNVVSQPMLTAITPISEDHKEYLGDNLAAIAAEKAGILKPGVPCVVGPQASESMTVLEEKADAVHAPLFRFGKEWFLEQGPNGYAYVSERHHLPFSAPGLQGPHQWQNAATAIACMDVLADAGKAPCAMADEALGQGIVGATWPGRLQALPIGNLPHGSELWLDGGHNPAAGQVLTHWAEERWGETPELHLICGMLKDKDAKAFLTPLAGKVKRFWAVPIPDEPNSHPPHALAELASSLGMKAMAAPSVPAVLQAIATHENTVPQRVLIAGSLYLAGAVLAQYSQSL